ncbi:MAG: ankyrin repeat domain-containing protein [Proteobacteria bacterium]|nr:ankyrin repeat domain-containing protein [Pseudomonadota bacterium]
MDIFGAIQSNNLAQLKVLIEQNKVNVNCRDADDLTPLMVAVTEDKPEIVEFLLEQGADPYLTTGDGETALWGARECTVSKETFLALIKKIAVDKGYIEVNDEDDIDIIINKLITTLLYKSNRHNWNTYPCVELRDFIADLDPSFSKKNKVFFERYIQEQETENNTFYGSYLSDNSDSEDEKAFIKLSSVEKKGRLKDPQTFTSRGQIGNLCYQINTKKHAKGDLKPFKSGSDTFNLQARSRIHHPGEQLTKIEGDLAKLNQKMKAQLSIEEAIRELKAEDPTFTDFFIAEYRGITYQTTKWNKPSRIAHRKDESEIAKPLFSNSVMSSLGLGFFNDYENAAEKIKSKQAEIESQAKLLREILLCMREPKGYTFRHYSYNCLAHLIQNVYTDDYDGFHKLIKEHPVLKELFLNGYNPFISMGDIPYHAEKYAHGIKPYKGHEPFRLRPRWQENGQAERPYSGVVYTSLHPLTDFNKEGPLHVVSLNRNAEIKLEDELMIVAERESCFPSYVPEGRVFHKHMAKYPSFKGQYKQIYLIKYGLTSELYYKFKQQLAGAKPHSEEMKNFKKTLGEWLCSFHEVKLIELARREAEKRAGILIYRDVDGGFCLKPPLDSVNRHSNEVKPEMKTPVKAKQKKRQEESPKSPNIEVLNKSFGSLNLGESKFAIVEKNTSSSMALSLLISAVSNHYHLALDHFLKKEVFRDEINKSFQCKGLKDSKLLHLAVLAANANALTILLANKTILPNAVAAEIKIGQERFFNISALHLALIRGNESLALQLIQDERSDFSKNITSSLRDNISVLDLAIENNCPLVIRVLAEKGIDLKAKTQGKTPLRLALEKKQYWVAAELIRHKVGISKLIQPFIDTIDSMFLIYILDSKMPINKKNVADDVFQFLLALKDNYPSYLSPIDELESGLGGIKLN